MNADNRTRQGAVSAGKFFLALVLCFVVLYGLASLVPIQLFERVFASLLRHTLALFRIPATSGIDVDAFVQVTDGPRILISGLCTGLLEMIILSSAILATLEIDTRKRLVGVAVGVIAIGLFNWFRIVATTLIALSQPIEVVELSHEVLFRVFLFLVIAGFYWTWLRWANPAQRSPRMEKQ
jgi:exosortase/archaeosortase family protein